VSAANWSWHGSTDGTGTIWSLPYGERISQSEYRLIAMSGQPADRIDMATILRAPVMLDILRRQLRGERIKLATIKKIVDSIDAGDLSDGMNPPNNDSGE